MKFNYMNKKNEILTEIQINNKTKKVKIKNHMSSPLNCAFGIKKTVEYRDVIKFLENRTFEPNRSDLDDILSLFGLKEYDPYLLCKMLHGKCEGNDNWIDFQED